MLVFKAYQSFYDMKLKVEFYRIQVGCPQQNGNIFFSC